MKVFGIDPGSTRTGYGCIESDGSRHRLLDCGVVASSPGTSFPARLLAIHAGLTELIRSHRPDCVAVENVFAAVNIRSALRLGHARGVAVLAAAEAAVPIVEYSPAEVKRAVVGFGRAEKQQVQQMVALLLGLDRVPTPHDAADALAVAICHLHGTPPVPLGEPAASGDAPSVRRWRDYRPGADVPGRSARSR